ncbi:hypothetical protein R3P38DRAFT_2741535 [Favolaschia claudopus]|uniref:Uncharacterized protein n=1 Tax=Favolaschia claudopus TaxID=2862362 RepID=A0AAV9ZSP0_9AGAR
MSLNTDTVRAIGIFKTRQEYTTAEIDKNLPAVIEHIKKIPVVQSNLTKYEVSYKAEKLPTTLAKDLGLKDTEFTTVVIVEGKSHEKIREALTHPDYLTVIKGSLDQVTTIDDFHFFAAEFATII